MQESFLTCADVILQMCQNYTSSENTIDNMQRCQYAHVDQSDRDIGMKGLVILSK